MGYVVKAVKDDKGSQLQGAWGIYAVHGEVERSLIIVPKNEYPELETSSELVYVEGQKGSACRTSGFLVNGGRSFIACNLG
jgi:hypothetical protein